MTVLSYFHQICICSLFKGQTLAASHLHWRSGSSRSFTWIRKKAVIFCGSFLRKGEVFAYVGSIQTHQGYLACKKSQPPRTLP